MHIHPTVVSEFIPTMMSETSAVAMTIEIKARYLSHRAEVRREMNMLKNVDEMQQLGK